MSKRIPRRMVLRGLGGAAVVAPFLKSVDARLAKAQDMPVSAPPRRLIIMYTSYGCITTQWFPEKSHGALAASDFMGTTLEVLAPMADKLLLPRGIRAMNEWTIDASLGQGNDPHTNAAGSYFTCAPLTPHLADPLDITNAGAKFNAMPIGPSLDHVCAKQLNTDGMPLFLNVAGVQDSTSSRISYSAAEEPFLGITNLSEVVQQLTGLFMGGAPKDDFLALRKQSMLDLVKADLEALERFDMSQADRNKLEVWKDLLQQTGPLLSTACGQDLAQQLGLTGEFETSVDISEPLPQGLDRADLASNVAALAAICDMNRVIVLKYPASYVFQGLGLDSDSDNMNHRVGSPSLSGSCREGVTEDLLTLDRYYAKKFAHLVQVLDAVDETDGTLLDHSATVWFHETSDGAALNLNNMPIIQAGGCAGYFKTGQAVNVFDGTADLHRGNSEAPCMIEGGFQDHKVFGTPPEIANAPINKYYCNLMNAIGVRAGSDGFPAVGGTQEVTHYGVYDDTTEFIHPDVNPPIIKYPGEFPELRGNA